MFSRCLAVFAALVIFAASPAFAQTNSFVPFGRERELRRLPEEARSDSVLSRSACGDYFIFTGADDEPDGHARIGYFLEPRPTDPENALIGGAFRVDKFDIVIDETKRAPTATLVSGRGAALVRVLVRLSSRDYSRAARCLPSPQSRGSSPPRS